MSKILRKKWSIVVQNDRHHIAHFYIFGFLNVVISYYVPSHIIFLQVDKSTSNFNIGTHLQII